MLSRSKIQYLRSLHDRKTRYELGRFIIEGKKSILEAIGSDLRIVEGFVTHDCIPPLQRDFPLELISEKSLHQISSLTSNRDGLIVVEMPRTPLDVPSDTLTLVLDGINDPGNLGTIVRTADWYGLTTIIASRDTVDIYNPKALMATMGSFTRVRVMYTDIAEYLREK